MFTQKHETKHSHYKELIHMECETLKTFYKKEQSYIQYIKHLRTQKPISVNAEAVMSQVIKLFIAKCKLVHVKNTHFPELPMLELK